MRRFYVATLLLSLGSLTVLGQTQPAQNQKQQQQKLEKKSLATSEEDRLMYSEFLKEPNTGLIILLPRGRYEVNAAEVPKKKTQITPIALSSFPRKTSEDLSGTVASAINPGQAPTGSGASSTPNPPALSNLDDLPSVDPRTGNARTGIKSDVLRGGGAYYSFSLLTHEYNYGSDLSLERGQFRVGFAGADYGFLTNLGDVSLESISLDTHEAKRLAAYARVRQEADARLEYRRFGQGTEIDGCESQKPSADGTELDLFGALDKL